MATTEITTKAAMPTKVSVSTPPNRPFSRFSSLIRPRNSSTPLTIAAAPLTAET